MKYLTIHASTVVKSVSVEVLTNPFIDIKDLRRKVESKELPLHF